MQCTDDIQCRPIIPCTWGAHGARCMFGALHCRLLPTHLNATKQSRRSCFNQTNSPNSLTSSKTQEEDNRYSPSVGFGVVEIFTRYPCLFSFFFSQLNELRLSSICFNYTRIRFCFRIFAECFLSQFDLFATRPPHDA